MNTPSLFAFAVATLACAFTSFADPTPKAVLDSNERTLTFYYDENEYSGDGITQYVMNSGSNNPGWAACGATNAVFSESFKNYQPTCVYRWFYNMASLTSVDGLANLDTARLASMRRMFQGAGKLTGLDLSGFDTSNVTDTREMFSGCKELTAIYVSDRWTNAGMGTNSDMFKSCSKLVGGAGTTYDSSHVGPEYAHVDGGSDDPGYLTLKRIAVPPSIQSVDVSVTGQTEATVTVDGSDLADGEVTVELRIADETAASSSEPRFGGFAFSGLTHSTTYDVWVVASNVYGAVTNDTQSFTTFGEVGEYWEYDVDAGTVTWSEWTFDAALAQDGTVKVGAVTQWPDVMMPLDFSRPVRDAHGTVYVISELSPAFGHHDATSGWKPAGYEPQCLRVGRLALPGEGLVSIGQAAFAGCANATGAISFPSTLTSFATSCFADCASLEIDGSSIPGDIAQIPQYCFKGDESMSGDVTLTNATWIADSAFQNTAITSATFGPNLIVVGGNYERGAFQGCTALTNLVFDAASSARISNTFTFQDCSALEELDLRGVVDFSIDVDRDDRSHLKGCLKLKKITFGAGLTNLACNAMAGATALEAVVFEGVPPVVFEMPYLSATNSKGEHSAGYDSRMVKTYVHGKLVYTSNAAGVCWADYAADRRIAPERKNPANNTTWSGDFIYEGVDPGLRPLVSLEPDVGTTVIVK